MTLFDCFYNQIIKYANLNKLTSEHFLPPIDNQCILCDRGKILGFDIDNNYADLNAGDK